MNVVFDFGGVLFHWEPHELIARCLPHRAATTDAARELAQHFFQGYGGDWSDFDRGTLEPEALVERISRRIDVTPQEALAVIEAVPAALTPQPGTVALLHRLHAAGHALYFLSNMPAPYASHLEATHGFMTLFRGGVFSGRVRLLKPEPAIYALALDRFGLAAHETLFIDDLAHNVDAARAAGWQGLHFTSPEACEAELVRLGHLRE